MFAERTGWSLEANRLARALDERRRAGGDILDLTESNPTRCGFDYPQVEILAALGDPRSLEYHPDPRGLLEARKAVAAYYAERGAAVDPQQIFLTGSTSEAYSYVFRLLGNAGDAILAPAPSYPLFDFLARLNDLELESYRLVYDHEWRVDLAALEAASPGRVGALLGVHPNNPTGSFVRARELEALVAYCRRHGLALVADEVFADYAHAPDVPAHPSGPRVPTHAAENRVLTFTLSGLSKISALPQMKLAWLVVSGPEEARRRAMARLEVIADTYLSVSAPLALALPKLLDLRRAMQPQVLARVLENLRRLDAELAREAPLGRLHVEGGWYAVLRLPATRSDEEWALELLREDGVYVHPGHFFDFAADGHLVVSLLPRPEIFAEALGRLHARVRKLA